MKNNSTSILQYNMSCRPIGYGYDDTYKKR